MKKNKIMKKGLKIAVLLGTIGVIGTVSYLVYKKFRPNLDEGQNESNESNSKPKQPASSVTTTDKPKSTPFKNKTEGDSFRAWVNETYPKYAKSIDLDKSGSYNNAYIRKAYAKYGAEYKPRIKDVSNAWKFNLPFNLR